MFEGLDIQGIFGMTLYSFNCKSNFENLINTTLEYPNVQGVHSGVASQFLVAQWETMNVEFSFGELITLTLH